MDLDERHDTRAALDHESSGTIVRQGFADAEIGVPPPPRGSTVPRLRLSRPERSADELGKRLGVVLDTMGLALDPLAMQAWAAAASSIELAAEPSVSEPSPGLVVVYGRELDDLMVIDTSILDMPTPTDADIVPWDAARRVVQMLIDQGIMSSRLTLDLADVSFVRSGVKGPDGTHERWVDEVVFEANLRVDGVEVIDAGVRIGITPAGRIASVRVTGIEIERVGTVTIEATALALEDAFAEYLLASAPPLDAVQVSIRRPVYMLEPSARSALVEPRYMVTYAIVVRDGDTTVTSRSKITLWSMTSPVPTIEARLPEASTHPSMRMSP